MPEILIDTQLKTKVLEGRKAVDAYREAHRLLHAGGWYKGMSDDQTPLLEKLVSDLEQIGITSAELDFESKKNEVLAKFSQDSELLNILELGFTSKEDFTLKATVVDIQRLETEMWH